MKREILLCTSMLLGIASVFAQTTTNDGDWDDNGNWNTSSPGTGWSTINIEHDIERIGDWTVAGTLNINAGGRLTLDGTIDVSGGSAINVYGELDISTNAELTDGFLRIYPGGSVIIDGNINIQNANYLIVGTNQDPAVSGYADLIVKGDVNSSNSGDITVERNGRMAVYGSMYDNGGGGTFIQVKDGGQVYVDGDIVYSGGGSIINENTDGNGGLYVNGTVTNPGGTTTTNIGDRDDLIADSNDDFDDWVTVIEDSPLPVVLTSFIVKSKIDYITISWTTSSELNNDYFNLYRSSNGQDFEIIATIQGNGTTNETQSYDHEDYPSQGVYYYQLEQVDYDGKNEFFSIKKVNFNLSQASELEVYPVPLATGDDFYISLSEEKVITASIYDLSGRTNVALPYEEQLGRVKINSSGLGLLPGVYVIRIATELGQYTQKLRLY